MRDIQNVIEAEYHIITEEPPPKPEGDEKIGAKEKKGGGEAKPAATSLSSPKGERETSGAPPAARRDPATVTKEDIPNLNALAKVCFQCWGMQPAEVWKELGYKSMLSVSESPWDCWLKIRAVKTGE
ncbi:unnamed protein product [marine sediment metagenome]|uniref:Uncharacterized protein n=1 Tax=marine sediment metagenome TaxID=412755 RepID=X1LJ05_9ZZZZ